VLTQQEAGALTVDAGVSSANIARTATSKLEGWFDEREKDLTDYARILLPTVGTAEGATQLASLSVSGANDAYDLIEVTDPTGRVLAASPGSQAIDVSTQSWLGAAAKAYTLTNPQVVNNRVLVAGGDPAGRRRRDARPPGRQPEARPARRAALVLQPRGRAPRGDRDPGRRPPAPPAVQPGDGDDQQRRRHGGGWRAPDPWWTRSRCTMP